MGLIENLEQYDKEPKYLEDFFKLIRKILTEWVDFNEKEYYNIVSLWILGTWLHDKFVSYPYLFINAMKQSGKTRLLKIIQILSNNGFFTTNLTESVLFRLPAVKKPLTMCIDEFENISSKEKANLRELLNSGYKKGLFIARSRKLPNETWHIDTFEVYTPIAIANISGIDDVLEDRCLTIPLERSNNVEIINKPEFFDLNPNIYSFKLFISTLCSLCSFVRCRNIYGDRIETTLTTPITLTVQTTPIIENLKDTSQETSNLEKKVPTPNPLNFDYLIENGIVGRYLELWHPILWLAFNIDKELFDNLIPFIAKTIQEKKEIELMENRDVIFLSFLYNNFEETGKFITLRSISEEYKRTEPEDLWFNSKWVGRAIKRHRIAFEKRRTRGGFEIRINFQKLADLCKKLGIEKQEKDKIVEEIQADLKERPDWYDFQEEKEKSES